MVGKRGVIPSMAQEADDAAQDLKRQGSVKASESDRSLRWPDPDDKLRPLGPDHPL